MYLVPGTMLRIDCPCISLGYSYSYVPSTLPLLLSPPQ